MLKVETRKQEDNWIKYENRGCECKYFEYVCNYKKGERMDIRGILLIGKIETKRSPNKDKGGMPCFKCAIREPFSLDVDTLYVFKNKGNKSCELSMENAPHVSVGETN